jgi:hypothetical protein
MEAADMPGNPSKERLAQQRERRLRLALGRFISRNEAKRKAAGKVEAIALRQRER